MSSKILTGILGKHYKLQTSENFDEYMKALGETTRASMYLVQIIRDLSWYLFTYWFSNQSEIDYFLTTMWD